MNTQLLFPYPHQNNHLGTPQELTDDDGNVMWWRRRPRGVGVYPPAQGRELPNCKAAMIVLLLVACVLPTAAVAIMAMALLDWLLVSRVAVLKKWLK